MTSAAVGMELYHGHKLNSVIDLARVVEETMKTGVSTSAILLKK